MSNTYATTFKDTDKMEDEEEGEDERKENQHNCLDDDDSKMLTMRGKRVIEE